MDVNGNVTVVSDHECLGSSKIEGHPSGSEGCNKMDKKSEGLEQLKYTGLDLNETQKQAVNELIQKMTEELHREPQ